MKRGFVIVGILGIVLVGLFGIIGLSVDQANSQPSTGPPSGLDVNVTNPTLDVSNSSVSVSNLPRATSGGNTTVPVSGDVNATVTGDVNVGNTPEEPLYVRDVDRPAVEPFMGGCTVNGTSGYPDRCVFLPAVEAGKRLVVEFISGEVRITTGETFSLDTLIYDSGGFFSNHHLNQPLQRTNVFGGYDLYIVSQPFRIYIDGEEWLSVRVNHESDDIGGRFWITGHLVDVEE